MVIQVIIIRNPGTPPQIRPWEESSPVVFVPSAQCTLFLFLIYIVHFLLQLFRDAIKAATKYKSNPTDIMDEIMQELEVGFCC